MVFRRITLSALAAAIGLTATACDSFLEVSNPNIIEADSVDPVADGAVFSYSALQNLATAYGPLIVYSAWHTTEGYVGDSYPTRMQFGQRRVGETNTTFNSELWVPLSRALASSEDVLDILGNAEGAEEDVNVARAALAAGYAYQLMGEMFCEGVERGGPALSTAELLGRAADRFQRASDVGFAAGSTDGKAIANTALVGRARALLQAGKYAEAATVAGQVADDFNFNLAYVDDQARRTALGNGLFYWSHGGARESFVVPPAYRQMADDGDPRIAYADAGKAAQDEDLHFYTQKKYDSWQAPVRLASGLEARYIKAEAELMGDIGSTAALALIAERRAAGDQGLFLGVGKDVILAELMDQRSRDFWLEGKRMGDWRRNPDAVPNVLPAGEGNYYQTLAPNKDVGTQTCWPIPFAERNANGNF
jgi:hypothetical protein